MIDNQLLLIPLMLVAFFAQYAVVVWAWERRPGWQTGYFGGWDWAPVFSGIALVVAGTVLFGGIGLFTFGLAAGLGFIALGTR